MSGSTPRRRSPRPPRRSQEESSGVFGAAFDAAREQAGSQVGELVEQVKQEGQEFLDERKSLIAEQFANIGNAIRRAADKLHDTESEFIAAYVDRAADRAEDIGKYIDQRDLREVVEDAGVVARRQPVLFCGGMFLAGLAAARFVKAAVAEPPPRAGRPRRRR